MSDYYLPFDIQKEIIKRVVDVKSLTRFKSVSKEWEAFINSPEFITGYGVRDVHPHRLLLRYTVSPRNVKYVSFSDHDVQQQQLDFAPNVPDFVKDFISYQVIGTSCGLWCLYGSHISKETEMLVVWNPSIRKSVGICFPSELAWSESCTSFGFGVFPSAYDPTIVGIKWDIRKYERKVGVYTLSSNTWKMIPSSNIPHHESIILRWNATRFALGRFIYWAACFMFISDGIELELTNWILSFDLITHEFGEVNLPDSIAVNEREDISMSELNGSLVVSAYTHEVNGLVYGVWVMGEEGGSMTSFTKLFNIKTPDGLRVCKVLGFTISGEPLVETEKDNGESAAVQVYKPCLEHKNDLGISGETGSFSIFPYTESLLLINTSNGGIYF